MQNRLKQAQLAQVVAEVERLSQRREAELEREQVKEILQELSLPSDLLDDALVQLSRKEALFSQQRRNRWIAVGVAAVLVGAIATTTFFIQRHQQAIARISVAQNRVTLAQDNGSSLATINRQASKPVFEVYYRTTLKDAPLGEKLSLGCDWIDPSGQVRHQNRWQTRSIDKELWPTYCRYQFNLGAATGRWKVQMSYRGRTLSTNSFVLTSPRMNPGD